MANKMTKRDYFNELLSLSEVQSNSGLVQFIRHELELLEKKNSADRKPTKQQVANDSLKERIYEEMEENVLYSIAQIQKEFSFCEELSNQKVSILLHQMMDENKIKRVEEKRKVFFEKIAQ